MLSMVALRVLTREFGPLLLFLKSLLPFVLNLSLLMAIKAILAQSPLNSHILSPTTMNSSLNTMPPLIKTL